MKNNKQILLFLVFWLLQPAMAVPPRDVYPETEIKRFHSLTDLIYNAGTVDGQMLYWDSTSSRWLSSDETKLKWDDSTNILLVDTLNLNNALDVSSYTNLAGGTNITLSGDTLNVDDAFLVNDANDTTTGVLTAANFISSVATGTQSYAGTSTTVNTNLNADLWDGYQFADYMNQAIKTTSAPTFTGVTLSGLTLGSVPFAGTGGLISQDNSKFFWNNTDKRLGIGTASPQGSLHLETATATYAYFDCTLNSGSSQFFVRNDQLANSYISLGTFGSTKTGTLFGLTRANWSFIYADGTATNGLMIGTTVADPVIFGVNNDEKMRLHSDGNFGLGTITPDTKLQVVGDCKFGGDDANYVEIGTTGDIVFVGGAGLAFSEIYVKDNAVAMTLNSAAKVQVTIFGVNGQNNNATADHTNDHITITKAGKYLVTISAAVQNNAAQSHKIELGLWKNNGAAAFTNVHVHRSLTGGSTDVGSLSLSGIIDTAVSDTLEVWANTADAADRSVTVEDITLSITQIGG